MPLRCAGMYHDRNGVGLSARELTPSLLPPHRAFTEEARLNARLGIGSLLSDASADQSVRSANGLRDRDEDWKVRLVTDLPIATRGEEEDRAYCQDKDRQ